MRMLRSLAAYGCCCALVMLGSSGLRAQSSQGGLRGVVKDAQGVIPGVAVTMLNEQTNTTRETVTNGVGEYSFPAVEPSNYTVKAVVQGYKTFERKGVRVSTQSFVGLDISLEIGAIEETITVTAEAPLLETTNASTGDVLDTKSLESIPTAGRSVFLMANLQPTVQASGNAHWNRMQDQVGNSAMSMGGGAVRSNNYLVDGFPVTDLQNRASTNPTIEAIADMKVQVHTYDSEMGRTGGGVMNMAAKSGSNSFHGSGYGVFRPTALVDQLLIPKLQGQANVPEYWRDGGGGGGGPIVKNHTFFWFAGEKYVDNQPNASTFLVPTAAELTGNFSGLTRNGAPFYIKNPFATGTCSSTAGGAACFPGNIIPANMLNSVGVKLASYFPTPNTQVDNGQSNFSMTDLLPNTANQFTTKVDQHFNDAVALTGFFLRQQTHEANSNYNPVNDFVGSSYQLDRVIKTVVVNNTYVLNASTVLTLRGGYNHFDDNYNLNDRSGNPLNFNVSQLGWPASLTSQMADTQRFPTMTITGYKSSGWTNRQANGYYQYGGNGTLSKLSGSHSMKAGGDYRRIGTTSANYGASTGTFTFSGGYTGNSLADLLLGYPQPTSNIPLNTNLDGYVNYFSGYVQDDWRVNDRLTINYGVRLEHETGLMEKNNQITVNFDQNAVNPLNSQVNLIDPLTGQKRQLLGGLVFAGVNGAPTAQGNAPAIKPAPRVGAVFSIDDKTILRGGWGLYLFAVELPRGRNQRVGADRLLRDHPGLTAVVDCSDHEPEQSVPQRPAAAHRERAGSPHRRGRRCVLRRSQQGRSTSATVFGGPAARVAGRHEHQRRLYGHDRHQSELDRLERRLGQRIHQHQSTRSEVSESGAEHTRDGTEPVPGRAGRRHVLDRDLDPDRPAAAAVPGIRQRLHGAVHWRALAVQRGYFPAPQARHRCVGRHVQLHLQPAERQPVRRDQLLLERSGSAEQLHGHSRVGVLQPGSGVRPQPARLTTQGRDRADRHAAVRPGPQVPDQQRNR